MKHHTLQTGERFFKEIEDRRDSPGEVVMVMRRPAGRILVMTKDFYPEGVYRLPTGKMKPGESPEDALAREAFEETGARVSEKRLLGVVRCTLRHGAETVAYDSYVFVTPETSEPPTPHDADEGITDFREIAPSRLRDIADQLRALPEPWRDWGRFRAVVHDFVYREMCPVKLSA